MTFSDPRWLWALLAIPLLAFLEWNATRRARVALERLVGSRVGHSLLAQRLPRSHRIGAALRLSALAFLLLGGARPEWGREVVRRGASGSDLVLVIDVSASMDTRDVPPSRLAEARREALAVIDRMGGSRVGVVAFAGDALRLCPLTLDRGAARLVVEGLSSATSSDPGTDLGRGLRAALRVLPGGRREEQAIVLWTDGEDLETGARRVIEDVARAGVRVYAVGVGTRAGDVVPVTDEEGHVTDVKHDPGGNVVRSRLDEELLRAMARRTRGAYFGANRPGGELPRLLSAVSSVARAGRGERLVERPVARFPLCALLALLLLAFDAARSRSRREPEGEEAPMHSERTAAAAILMVLMLVPSTSRAQSYWARGDRAFHAGRYAEAESLYALRLKRGVSPEVEVNRATAGGLRGGSEEADSALGKLAGRDGLVGNMAGYNLGTLLGKRDQYDPALSALRRVLERDPRDVDARWNYELLMRRKQDEQKKQQKPQPQHEQPKPNPSGGGGGANPQNGANQPPQAPGSSSSSPPPPPSPSQGGGGRMSRPQAEQLLNALEDLARADQQRQRKVRVTKDKQGRDW
jgi:Ca-activated chloride channel family protein